MAANLAPLGDYKYSERARDVSASKSINPNLSGRELFIHITQQQQQQQQQQ
jgi:hypothetical protein